MSGSLSTFLRRRRSPQIVTPPYPRLDRQKRRAIRRVFAYGLLHPDAMHHSIWGQANPAINGLVEADRAASKAHDAIYAEPFDKQAASDAIWEVHNWLRPMIPVSGDEDE
jgi:hypothetical protein